MNSSQPRVEPSEFGLWLRKRNNISRRSSIGWRGNSIIFNFPKIPSMSTWEEVWRSHSLPHQVDPEAPQPLPKTIRCLLGRLANEAQTSCLERNRIVVSFRLWNFLPECLNIYFSDFHAQPDRLWYVDTFIAFSSSWNLPRQYERREASMFLSVTVI